MAVAARIADQTADIRRDLMAADPTDVRAAVAGIEAAVPVPPIAGRAAVAGIEAAVPPIAGRAAAAVVDIVAAVAAVLEAEAGVVLEAAADPRIRLRHTAAEGLTGKIVKGLSSRAPPFTVYGFIVQETIE